MTTSDYRTDPEVIRCRNLLDEATNAARRAGELFRDTGAGKVVVEAYEAWIKARIAAGDPWAKEVYDKWLGPNLNSP